MVARRMPRSRSRIFHIKHRYWLSNSRAGMVLARLLGFLWVDNDLNISKDRWVVRGHWPLIHKDGGIVPASILRREHKTQKTIRISDLNWDELKHVKRRGKRLYFSINEVFNQAHALHRKLALEEKGDARFETDEIAQQIKDARDRHGFTEATCMVMTLSTLGNPRRRFAAAQRVGLGPRVLLARGPIPRSWEPVITYVRGPMKWKD